MYNTASKTIISQIIIKGIIARGFGVAEIG